MDELSVFPPAAFGPACSPTRYDVDTVSGAPFIDIASSPLATDLTGAVAINYEEVPGGIGRARIRRHTGAQRACAPL